MTALANLYNRANRPDEALKLREQALPLRRKVNGPEHLYTLAAMTDLASSLGDAGRLPEALELQEQSLAIKRRVLPPSRQAYLEVALGNMARLYDKAGRTNEAISLRQELADLKVKTRATKTAQP
jgi:tetratricopeptide (TPR) repeat protein